MNKMESTNFINVGYIFQTIYDLFSGRYLSNGNWLLNLILKILSFIKPLSVILTLLFTTGIIYCVIRLRAVRREIMEKVHVHGGDHGRSGEAHGSASSAAGQRESVQSSNERWQKIQSHIHSLNQSDWRLAILECDIILDEMLTKMSYHGETLGDKLKAVERSDFLTIDKAWEAHNVRNAIAHEGSNFQITDREAQRVVGLYEEVFKEFHYI